MQRDDSFASMQPPQKVHKAEKNDEVDDEAEESSVDEEAGAHVEGLLGQLLSMYLSSKNFAYFLGTCEEIHNALQELDASLVEDDRPPLPSVAILQQLFKEYEACSPRNDGCFVEVYQDQYRLYPKSYITESISEVYSQSGAIYILKIPVDVSISRESRAMLRGSELAGERLVICQVGKAEGRAKRSSVLKGGLKVMHYSDNTPIQAALNRFKEKVKEWDIVSQHELAIPLEEDEWKNIQKNQDLACVLFRNESSRCAADSERHIRYLAGVPFSKRGLCVKLPSDSEYVILTESRFLQIRAFWQKHDFVLSSLNELQGELLQISENSMFLDLGISISFMVKSSKQVRSKEFHQIVHMDRKHL